MSIEPECSNNNKRKESCLQVLCDTAFLQGAWAKHLLKANRKPFFKGPADGRTEFEKHNKFTVWLKFRN